MSPASLHPLGMPFFFETKRERAQTTTRGFFSFIGKKKSPATQRYKLIRRTGRSPAPLGVGLHLRKKSQRFFLGTHSPIFFSCLGRRLGCQALIQNRSVFRSILWRGWEAAHIPGKFSGRKSLWKRVGVYSAVSEAFQNHE